MGTHRQSVSGDQPPRPNVRIHRTTLEQPVVRFERDERALLQPLPARPYHSLVVDRSPRPAPKAPAPPAPTLPSLVVERRPLSEYAELVGGGR